MVADHFETSNPIIYPPEICCMKPLLPKRGIISDAVEIGSPLREPKDINSLPRIFGRPTGNGFERERADLNLDCNWDIVDVGTHVWPGTLQGPLQRNIGDSRLLKKCFVNLHLASAVGFRLGQIEPAKHGRRMSEVAAARRASPKDHQFAAFGANEWRV